MGNPLSLDELEKQAAPTMLVNVIIEQDGYQIKPDVHLELNNDGIWYVTWVEGLAVDPRWLDQQNSSDSMATDQSDDDRLSRPSDVQQATRELREVFQNKPGVSIEPID
ncbi:MAG: hypothetical protein R3C11_17490 [Planctomycetaceae bacterium]